MPDTLLSPLPSATHDQRRRWSDLLWTTIGYVDKGQSNYWTGEQLRLIAKEIEPPLKANGDNDA